jgi:hypothetical protein
VTGGGGHLVFGTGINTTINERMRITDTGNVGIGTTNPSGKLQISAVASTTWLYLQNSSESPFYTRIFNNGTGNGVNTIFTKIAMGYGSTDNSSINFYRGSSGTGGFLTFTTNTDIERMRIDDSGNVGIGTSTPLTKLHVVGGTTIEGNLVMAGTANISGINKITVNTVDPLYSILGTNYSSFAPSVVGGVKEEVTGKININTKVGNEYQAIIDFGKQVEGSDLWVWHKVIDFNKNNVEAVITPYGSFANTYYYINNNTLVFRSDRPVEIAYRLLAKRFDWKEWPTRATDQTEKAGLIIK